MTVDVPRIEYADLWLFDGNYDSVQASFRSVVNPGDNILDERDQFVLEIVTLVMPSSHNTGGTILSVTSDFSHKNSTTAIFEGKQTFKISISQPVLTWELAQNFDGDAADVMNYSVVIRHSPDSTAAAYGVDITGDFLPFFHLIPSSVNVSYPNASINVDNSLIRIPLLLEGMNITVNFSLYLDNYVEASTVVSNALNMIYFTSIAGGANTYLLVIIFLYLYILHI